MCVWIYAWGMVETILILRQIKEYALERNVIILHLLA